MTPTRHIKRSLLTALLPFLMVLLLTLLGCGGFQYTGIGTPTSGFDATPYALQIAREAYRVHKNRAPTGHDFGGGIIVVQYTDGSKPSEIASKIYEGYNNPSPSGDKNATHSERRTEDDFVLPTLAILKSHGTVAKASEIDVIIFTQFYPCETCLPEMSAWQNQERLAAGVGERVPDRLDAYKVLLPPRSQPQKVGAAGHQERERYSEGQHQLRRADHSHTLSTKAAGFQTRGQGLTSVVTSPSAARSPC